jgi:DnaJ-domain-containing protein 1
MWVQNQDDRERISAQTDVGWALPTGSEELQNYYTVLGLSYSASIVEIRKAYWEFSKRYHPDTTNLPSDLAREKFQEVKEAYGILSDPRQRAIYDQQLRFYQQKIYEHQLRQGLAPNRAYARPSSRSSSLEPVDRPLSAGEISALFFMAITVLGCIMLAIAIALFRGDPLLPTISGFCFPPG